MYDDLFSCPTLIEEACNFTQTDKVAMEVEDCEKVMTSFKNKTEVQ